MPVGYTEAPKFIRQQWLDSVDNVFATDEDVTNLELEKQDKIYKNTDLTEAQILALDNTNSDNFGVYRISNSEIEYEIKPNETNKLNYSKTEVDTLFDGTLRNVNILPHTQQTTIAKGATLRSFDGVSWESDTVEGNRDGNVEFNTPWGLTVFMRSSDRQFFWKNSTGVNKQVSVEVEYYNVDISTDFGGTKKTFQNIGNIAFNAWDLNQQYYHTRAGNQEILKLRWSDSNADYINGNYQ